MSKPTYNVIYKARSYTAEDGSNRYAYSTIGAAWADETGQINRLQLDTIPVTWDGVLYLRAREEKASS